MRVIPYILYALLIGFHQVILKDLVGIAEFTFNIPVLVVLLVALYKDETIAMWFGFAAGLTMSAGEPLLLGWNGLIMAVLGLAGFHVRQRLNLDSLYSKLLMVLGGVFLYNLIWTLVGGAAGFFHLLWAEVLFGTLYTGFFAWLFFLFKEKIITWQRTKELF